jgi:catechol 2,3-dioxygenase-like lactoylglutathione lyase family enzyme
MAEGDMGTPKDISIPLVSEHGATEDTARGLEGLHHVTAIASEPQQNINFYTGVLGLRLVKLTVNFDDPTTYHLYHGDGQGHPGTILTFFRWPGAPRRRICDSGLSPYHGFGKWLRAHRVSTDRDARLSPNRETWKSIPLQPGERRPQHNLRSGLRARGPSWKGGRRNRTIT